MYLLPNMNWDNWNLKKVRFSYRKDQDGIHRLQTVRYESLEVTQEMIKSESLQSSNVAKGVSYSLKYDNDGKSNYVLSVSENGEQSIKMTEQKNKNNILITINDVDEHGNIVRSEVVESGDIIKTVVDKEEIIVDNNSVEALTKTDGGVEKKGNPSIKRGKIKKRRRKKVMKKKSRSLPVIEEEDDVRHFSKDVILNYNKFQIKTPRSE